MKARHVLLAALLATLAGCTTVSTSIDFDRAADFTRYRTYRWIAPREPIADSVAQKRLTAAVDRQLAATGLTLAEPPDLLVSIHARLTREVVFEAETWGYGWGHVHGNVVFTRPEEIPIGTLVVDLVDARSSELVWRGIARRVVDPMASPGEKEKRAAETAARLFARYPPKR
jgi:hypothetical protein